MILPKTHWWKPEVEQAHWVHSFYRNSLQQQKIEGAGGEKEFSLDKSQLF